MTDTRARLPLTAPSELDLDMFTVEDLRDQAERWEQRGKLTESRAFAEALATRCPDDSQALLRAARLAAYDPEAHAVADRWFQLAERLGPVGVQDRLLWVGALVGAGSAAPARRALARLVGAFPEEPRALVEAAEWYGELRDPERAWRTAAMALRLLPMHGMDDRTTASLLGRIRRLAPPGWNPTRDVVDRVTRLADQGSESRLASAELLFRIDVSSTAVGDRPLAAQVLDVLASDGQDSTDPRVWLLRARAYVAQDDDVIASEIYDRFPPTGDLVDTFNQTVSLLTVGRPHEARMALDATWAALNQLASAAGSSPGEAVRSVQISLEILGALLAELSYDYARKWSHIRAAVELFAHVSDAALSATAQMDLLRMRLWLARTWEARDVVLEEMVALDKDRADSQAITTTTLLESLQWAGQVEPPGELADRALAVERLSRLRTQAELLARSSLVRTAPAAKGRRDLVQCARFALLVGDRHTARALLDDAGPPPPTGPNKVVPGGMSKSWQEAQLRAQILLENGQPEASFRLMESVMKLWRQDLNARLFFVHVARASGNLEEAAREATSCAATAVDNPLARLLAAECLFDLALARRTATIPPPGDGSQSSGTGLAAADSEIHDNLQQLIRVTAEYRRTLEAHLALADWLAGDQSVPPPPRLASDLLPSVAVEEVCRQGLHAAVLAGEGMERLRLTRDAELEGHVDFFVTQLRLHQRLPRKASLWTRASTRVVGTRDEATRLERLFTADRRARGARRWGRLAYVLTGVGLVVTGQVLKGADELTVGLSLAGLAVALAPFFTSVKLVGLFEMSSRTQEDFRRRRSELLRSAPVSRFKQMPLSQLPSLPTWLPNQSSDDVKQGTPRPSSSKASPGGANDTKAGAEKTNASKSVGDGNGQPQYAGIQDASMNPTVHADEPVTVPEPSEPSG